MEHPKQQIAFFEEEVKDIMGKPPQYLIRWGISLYSILFLFVVILSATIDYPVYQGFQARVTPLNIGQNISLEEGEEIIKLSAEDGAFVHKDNVLIQTNQRNIKATLNGKSRLLKEIDQGFKSTASGNEILVIKPELQDYELELSIPKAYINKINISQKVTFNLDSKVIHGAISSISSSPGENGNYLVKAYSNANQTYIGTPEEAFVNVRIDNKKILHKILNL